MHELTGNAKLGPLLLYHASFNKSGETRTLMHTEPKYQRPSNISTTWRLHRFWARSSRPGTSARSWGRLPNRRRCWWGATPVGRPPADAWTENPGPGPGTARCDSSPEQFELGCWKTISCKLLQVLKNVNTGKRPFAKNCIWIGRKQKMRETFSSKRFGEIPPPITFTQNCRFCRYFFSKFMLQKKVG